MPRPLRALSAALALVIALTLPSLLASPSVAGQATWRPPAGAVFNNPAGSKAARWRIINTINAATRHARPGSTIWMALYLMDSKSTADALINAHQRGVRVRMVVSKGNASTHQMARIARAVNKDNNDDAPGELKWGPDGSFVKYCVGGCRTKAGFIHSKFYVFSQTGAARDVVMVSSSNPNRGGANAGWNNLFVAHGKSRLVNHPTQGFAAVHDEMSRDRPVDNPYREVEEGAFQAGFLPALSGYDPIYSNLSAVRCKGATGGAGSKGRTVIKIGMFVWTGDRGVRFARKVAELGRAGCRIGVIHAFLGKRVRDILRPAAKRGQVKLWDSKIDRNRDGNYEYRIHHKVLMVSGVYRGDSSSWTVHTSSDNWVNDTTRRSDENHLVIAKRGAYNTYVKNWNRIRSGHARRIASP